MKEIEYDDAKFYVGQNSSENDKLFEIMPNNSIWFHLDSKSSSHVYCVTNGKLTKEHIKKGSQLVKSWSKKNDKVIYVSKSNLKHIGPGILDITGEYKYA